MSLVLCSSEDQSSQVGQQNLLVLLTLDTFIFLEISYSASDLSIYGLYSFGFSHINFFKVSVSTTPSISQDLYEHQYSIEVEIFLST